MKTLLILSLLLISATPAVAQDSNALYRDIMLYGDSYTVNEAEVQQGLTAQEAEEAAKTAKETARQLLQKRPQTLRKQSFPKLRQRPSKTSKPAELAKTQAAPFGLIWGSTIADTRNQGISLQPIEEKDYVNNFAASRLPKMIDDFERIDITFGEEDKLWRIIAYGKLLDDDAAASRVMRLYKIYNDLLTKKYGHAQEFFTPATIEVEKKDARGKVHMVPEDAPIGNPDFLKQLQAGTAVLYSTYYNQDVGAALAVNVDGEGRSYIIIDYKNLKILRAEENKTLDAL